MKATTIFKTLGPIDAKNIQRDALLLWIPLIPIILALVMRTAVPPATRLLNADYGFDLTPYYPLILSFFVLMAPAVGGMIVGFLLLDERDDQTLTALMVTPMPLNGYLLYRISLPIGLGLIMTVIGYPLIGLRPLAPADLLVIACLASFTGPLMALFLAGFAENKVAGFALMKVANGLSAVPMVAYFFDPPWQWLAGVMPMFWPLKLFWLAADGRPYGWVAAVGLVVNATAVYLLLQRFKRVLHR